MKIGLISDTHSFLDPLISQYFRDCDEVWHAGDIGNWSIIEQLEQIAPLRAVYGNIDNAQINKSYPENNFFELENFKILITHIAGAPPKYNPRVKKLLNENTVDILICGHSHILKVVKDPIHNVLFINPGAAGIHGFHKVKTVMVFNINKGKIEEMKVIELGKRGQILTN